MLDGRAFAAKHRKGQQASNNSNGAENPRHSQLVCLITALHLESPAIFLDSSSSA